MNTKGANIFKGILVLGLAFAFILMASFTPAPKCWGQENWEAIENYVIKNINAPRKIAVFDHDGTLIHGDITEGIEEKAIPGVLKAIIDKKALKKEALSNIPEEFRNNAWAYYKKLEAQSRQKAYEWYPTLFAGYDQNEIMQMSDDIYQNVFKNYRHPEMIKLVKFLKMNGYEIFIVSASPDLLVKAAAFHWGIPRENIFGIEIPVNEKGILKAEVVKPITYAKGKVHAILNKIKARPGDALIIAGDSLKTDIDMLKLAKERNSLAIMVNATGKDLEYSASIGFINEKMIVFP